MSKKLESNITRKIAVAVKERWPIAYVRKISDRFQRGIPDLLIAWAAGGRLLFLAVEVKTEDGRVKPIQKVEGDEISRLTGPSNGAGQWMVATNKDEVLSKMEEMSGETLN